VKARVGPLCCHRTEVQEIEKLGPKQRGFKGEATGLKKKPERKEGGENWGGKRGLLRE